jgi:dephospho-CoA kinase
MTQNKPPVIGLTGGIASGKSTLTRHLKKRGAAVVDTDKVSRKVVLPGTPGLLAIEEAFGPVVLREDGTLYREKLGEIIFADEEKRMRLNAILHPLILNETKAQIEAAQQSGAAWVLVVVPLLFESGAQALMDEVWTVSIPEKLQVRRVMTRDRLDEAGAQRRIAAQMPDDERCRRADVVLINDASVTALKQAADQLLLEKGLWGGEA